MSLARSPPCGLQQADSLRAEITRWRGRVHCRERCPPGPCAARCHLMQSLIVVRGGAGGQTVPGWCSSMCSCGMCLSRRRCSSASRARSFHRRPSCSANGCRPVLVLVTSISVVGWSSRCCCLALIVARREFRSQRQRSLRCTRTIREAPVSLSASSSVRLGSSAGADGFQLVQKFGGRRPAS